MSGYSERSMVKPNNNGDDLGDEKQLKLGNNHDWFSAKVETNLDLNLSELKDLPLNQL